MTKTKTKTNIFWSKFTIFYIYRIVTELNFKVHFESFGLIFRKGRHSFG